eukprot:Skav215208  [mRNA]  locus=scaffold130:77506:102835:- [translate_table: standard]
MCLAKLDKFMVDILLPLAASTQALLLVNAVSGECGLSESLSRAYRMEKAKWGTKPPFVILSVTDDLPMLYLNHDPDAYWKLLRRQSKAWRSRDKVILETVHAYGTFGHKPDPENDFRNYDLDRDATTLLIVDQVDSNHRGFDSNPTNQLNVEIMRFLASTVPSLALKSCWANKSKDNNTSGYQVCLDQANSGTKLLLLDIRKRSPIDGDKVAAEDWQREDVVELVSIMAVTHDHRDEPRMMSQVKGLLLHPNVHSVNIHDTDACRRTLDTMVQSDSLPKKNALEGGCGGYKFQTKALFFAQLLYLGCPGITGKGAFKLESVLWCYRTRVGHFKLGQGIDIRETVLCQRLNAWSEELMSAADLKRSAWSRSFPAHAVDFVSESQPVRRRSPKPETTKDRPQPVVPREQTKSRQHFMGDQSLIQQLTKQ